VDDGQDDDDASVQEEVNRQDGVTVERNQAFHVLLGVEGDGFAPLGLSWFG
jgi:hypothetical protein